MGNVCSTDDKGSDYVLPANHLIAHRHIEANQETNRVQSAVNTNANSKVGTQPYVASDTKTGLNPFGT